MYWPDYDISLADFEDDGILDKTAGQSSYAVSSSRSRLVAGLLVIFLGAIGIHRLYLGKIDTALSMLILVLPSALARWYPLGWLFLAVLAAWVTVDAVRVLTGRMQDGEGKPVKNWR